MVKRGEGELIADAIFCAIFFNYNYYLLEYDAFWFSRGLTTFRMNVMSSSLSILNETARSSETSVNIYKLHGVTAQKPVMFTIAALKTSSIYPRIVKVLKH
jgi:hypothetical protein